MSLFRIAIVLGSALAVMMTVVVLRAESTALHFELSQYDTRVDRQHQDLHERELELARLRNPALIRARIADLRLGDVDPAKPKTQTPAATKPSAKPKKP